MGGVSDYLQNKLIDTVLGTQYTKPATVYIALYSATPSGSGGGTELSGNGYARVAVTNNSTNWPNAANGLKSSGADFTFPVATGAWDEATHWGIFDAATSGNLLFWGSLDAGVTAVNGSLLKFLSGEIDVSWS